MKPTKEEIKASNDPRVRQFLDRIPGEVAKGQFLEEHFEKYLETPEANS